ncbi:MAG: PAS domain S-box protein [Candidatus Didemnitutus sp.]|nr:PAS domain S-box protein [Candidatus Didemnitutus sp.]
MAPEVSPAPLAPPPKSYRSRAAKIVLAYAGFSALWIGLSDHVLAAMVPDRDLFADLAMIKGWFFVVVTSTLLFFWLRQSFGELAEHIAARGAAERLARQREEQLRALGDNLPGSYVYRLVRTEKGPRFLYASAGVERVHGITVEALLADANELFGQISAEDDARIFALGEQSFRTMRDFDVELRFQRADGVWRWLSLKSRPHHTETLGVVWDGVATDITERKQAETDLRLSRAKFLQAFSNNPAAIALTRLEDGLVLEVNDTWVALTGYSREEALGRTARHIWADPASATKFVAMLREHGVVRGWEETFRKKNGELFTAELSTRLLTSEGEATILSTLVDVTARRRQQRRVTLLADISRRLVVGDDPRSLVRGILADIARELECDMFANHMASASGNTLLLENYGGMTEELCGKLAVLDIGESLAGLVAQRKQPLVLADLPAVTLPQAQALIEVGLRAYCGQPLLVGDRLIGTITFGSRTRGRFAEEDVRLMKAVADQVATTLDRLQLHERLKQSEELFRQMAENIDAVFWMASAANNELIYVSPGYEIVWGRTREALYANPREWLEAIVPEDAERVTTAVARQASGGYREEFRIVRPDGSERWILDRAYPITDPNGKVIRIVGVARDVTEQKSLEERFLRAQRMEAVGTLASGVAHDLNNILAPILMVAGLLRDRQIDGETRRYLELMEGSAQRGAGIVAQLLTFSRGIGGERVPLQVEHLVVEIARLLNETLPRNIEVVRESAHRLPSVLANPTQVHQVLMNLCINARDAMPQGGRLTLAVAERAVDAAVAAAHDRVRAGQFVVLSVQDTGHGMTPELLRRIFDPFFTTKEVGKGTGLGLSTAVGIVRGHGGFIEVDSAAGRGTRFEVFLPALDCESSAVPVGGEEELPRGNGERVLVVDDEEAIRIAMREVLESVGYEVVNFPGVAEALAAWPQQRERVRVVITDLMMPGAQGWDLIYGLRADRADVPVIVCSGLGQSVTKEEAERAGVHCVLAKPFTALTLLREVRAALLAGGVARQ